MNQKPPRGASGGFVGLQTGIALCNVFRMSTVELIAQKTRALPAELQQEALHYVDYLLTRQAEITEAREWPRFSAEQLATQYAPGDAIYDQD